MEKKDLKAGYTLEDERGRKWYLFETKRGLMGCRFSGGQIVGGEQLDVNNALNDDLSIKNKTLHPACDIVKVYDLAIYIFDFFTNNYRDIKVLWKCEKPKTKVTLELTDEQFEKIKEIINE